MSGPETSTQTTLGPPTGPETSTQTTLGPPNSGQGGFRPDFAAQTLSIFEVRRKWFGRLPVYGVLNVAS